MAVFMADGSLSNPTPVHAGSAAFRIQALGVELNNMPVRIADVYLRVSGRGMRLHDHAVRIVEVGILPIAFRAKKLHCRAKTRYANGEMDVPCVERLVTKSGTIVNDQMKLLGIADLKPGARKRERRSGNFLHAQDLPVKPSRPLDIADSERNVVNGGDFHRDAPPIETPQKRS